MPNPRNDRRNDHRIKLGYVFNRTLSLKELEAKGVEIARNTFSAAEFIGDSLRAESRYFRLKAYQFLTSKLTGHKYRPNRDASLEPLAGVGTTAASASDESLLR